jgi:hypothetical protein
MRGQQGDSDHGKDCGWLNHSPLQTSMSWFLEMECVTLCGKRGFADGVRQRSGGGEVALD